MVSARNQEQQPASRSGAARLGPSAYFPSTALDCSWFVLLACSSSLFFRHDLVRITSIFPALNPVASIDRVLVPNSAPFGATRSAGECLPPLHAAFLQPTRKATVAVRRCRHLVGAAELPAPQVGRVRLPHTGGQSAQSLTSRYRRCKRGRYISHRPAKSAGGDRRSSAHSWFGADDI